jgi:cysteinyl-tRNA synthetase
MSMAHLGPSFDIHTGGVDLVFPHHEDEIAQSEAATGKPFVQTWLHCAHLRLDGAKMAKSAGNISRVVDLLEAGVSPRALRLALISVHYRQGVDFSDASLDAARAAIDRLDAGLGALRSYRDDHADDLSLAALLDATRERFDAALDDDLNVSASLAAVFDLIRETNRRIADRSMSTADAARAVALLTDLDTVLAVLPDEAAELPPGATELIAQRAAARERRDWAESDRLRGELLGVGVVIEDTRDGQRWRLGEPVA